jgi:hypothetical protein
MSGSAGLDDFVRSAEHTGRCVVMTDLDDTLSAFFGSDLDARTVAALASYLDAGGILVFNTGAPFDWFYARLLRPLIADLVARHGCAGRLAQMLLILSGGNQISVFQHGGYRLIWQGQGRDKGDGVDVGPQVPDMPGTFVNLGGGFMQTVSVFTAAADALRASGRAPPPAAAEQIGDAIVWTFEQEAFPAHSRVRIRVGASGYVHAGITHADGRWDPVYEVPLTPTPEGAFEAVLPPDADAFTFFWTQAPETPGHPGHWEREEQGGRVFREVAPNPLDAGSQRPAFRRQSGPSAVDDGDAAEREVAHGGKRPCPQPEHGHDQGG